MQPLASSRRQSALAARRWGATLGGAVICFVAGCGSGGQELVSADAGVRVWFPGTPEVRLSGPSPSTPESSWTAYHFTPAGTYQVTVLRQPAGARSPETWLREYRTQQRGRTDRTDYAETETRTGSVPGYLIRCQAPGDRPIECAIFAADDRLFVVEAQANAADGEAFFESAPVQRFFSSFEILPAASQP